MTNFIEFMTLTLPRSAGPSLSRRRARDVDQIAVNSLSRLRERVGVRVLSTSQVRTDHGS